MRVAVLTDVHANLPAFRAALEAIAVQSCDLIVHTGDLIGIGPHPAECLDLLLATPNLVPLMGNHDAWFAFGLPDPRPDWMSLGEVAHQHWTHAQLDPALRATVAAWPYVQRATYHDVTTTFVHYALAADGQSFQPVIVQPTGADLDHLFGGDDTQLVCYGHHHPRSDLTGKARYVNPGSLGCCARAEARYAVIEYHRGGYTVSLQAVGYDDAAVFAAFEARQVPEREVLYRLFFGGRFGNA